MNERPVFAWGVATSALQTEGYPSSDGRSPSIWDVFAQRKRKIAGGHTPATGTAFRSLYREDLALAARLGIPNFRFSVSWSRIKPDGYGRTNQDGLDFYDRLTDTCLEFGITPWLTLYHWDLPQALEEKGGWVNRSILDWFGEYSEAVLHRLSDRILHWMVLNEPLAFTGVGYFLGVHAPGKRGLKNFIPAMHHAVLAQADGIRRVNSFRKGLLSGTTFSCAHVVPATDSNSDIEAAQRADALFNRLFAEPLLGYGYPTKELPFINRAEQWMLQGDESRMVAQPSFIGIQNYTRETISHAWWIPYIRAKKVQNKRDPRPQTMLGWDIYPEGLYHQLMKFNAYPEIPSLVVTENGAAFSDIPVDGKINDLQRIEYLDSYIDAALKARSAGARVDGYFAWSLTDNFEWSEGYFPRFGLIYVDYKTQQRMVKDSGFHYAKKIHENTLISNENRDQRVL